MNDPASTPRARFLALLRRALDERSLVKLTLGKYRGVEPGLQNLFVRPVELKSGPQFSFLWRHATRDVTKNHPAGPALAELERLIGADFLDAHLFTATDNAQLETQPDGTARLRVKAVKATAPAAERTPSPGHDRPKSHLIPANASWLKALGVTNEHGQPREGMADKFRQIQKFAELLSHLLPDAFPSWAGPSVPPLHVVDMGAGKGYLTFALAAVLGERAQVEGVEARPELVELCNRVVVAEGWEERLRFTAGTIAEAELQSIDVLIALHACDTATDDALAKGVTAGAKLLVVAPCCQKELRKQLTPPPVLADALQHGIFQERQAEFVTDALRALLLEWAGYRTKVFEFISPDHTAKNLMIAAIQSHAPGDPERARRLREFAQFYGIRHQQLARHLSFTLDQP